MSDVTSNDADARAEQLHARAVSFQAVNADRHAHAMKLLRRGLYGSIGLNVLLGFGVASILPMKTFVPITGFINEAGIYDTTDDYANLPVATQAAGIESVLSNYLVYRERFAPSEADRDYEVVSKLSGDAVRREYQGDTNTKFNPQAPAKVVGPNGFIRVNVLKGADWVAHADDYSTGTYKIHFCRTMVRQDQPPVSQRLEEQVTYEKVAGIPADQRTTFNPPGIIVTAYPAAREEGAPGVANPCG